MEIAGATGGAGRWHYSGRIAEVDEKQLLRPQTAGY